jgi:hypothetical protein
VQVDDDINAAEALLSKSKKERVKASAAARDLHDKHKARHSTFYLGGGTTHTTNPPWFRMCGLVSSLESGSRNTSQ